MKKKIIAILACGALVFSLAACSSSDAEGQAETTDDTEAADDSGTDEQGRTYVNEFNPETNQVIELYEVEFQIPESWTPVDSSSALVYNSDSDNGTLSVGGGLSSQGYDMDSEEVQDEIVASMDAGDSFVETGRETRTVLGDITALYFSCTQNISDYPVDMYVLAFSTDEYIYMFSYADKQESEYNHSQEFDEIIDSITWAPEDAEAEEETEEQVDEETASVPEDDFFGDEERQEQYDELYTSYQLSALYDYVNEYIADTGDDISPDDSAYKILDLIEPLLDYKDTWVVTQDEFDSSYIVTFPGADEISGSESLKVTVSGTELTQTVGFMKEDWLFFNKFALSVDGEQVMSKTGIESYDKTEDVISGGTIEEAYSGSHLFDDEVCEQVKDADTVMIRFENTSEDKTYDHTFTDAEKNALYVSKLLRDNWTELSNLIYRYQNNIVIDEE